MPPKQKEVKKGPTYKQPTPSKDMVPSSIKEPPREPKPIRLPDSIPEPPKNNAPKVNVFDPWPGEEAVKAHDFGINSDQRFLDPYHNELVGMLHEKSIVEWKSFKEIDSLRKKLPRGQNDDSGNEQEREQDAPQSVYEIDMPPSEGEIQQQPMTVIETFLRDETEEEMQKRQKEEAQRAAQNAKDKKKGKKEELKEEGPIQVSDVKMSDVLIRRSMSSQGIWIGSQLQMVKERELVDVNNSSPIWKRIYPQENGVPQITKSGKYWVKLYYMGREVLVEVDDRMPIDYKARDLFPCSIKSHEKWTLILSKALFKLIRRAQGGDVVGNGMVVYALTGMLSQKVSLKNFSDWQNLEQLLSNEHYARRDVLVTLFAQSKSQTPSNFIQKPSEMRDMLLLENSSFTRKGHRKASAHQMGLFNMEEMEYKPTYVESGVLDGYGYCLGDFFSNGIFNMVFAQEKSFKEVKLKQQYNQLSKVSLVNKTREEKLDHRKKKKEVKERLAIEEKKRLDQIAKAPVQYHFVKLLADINIRCQFSEKQILLAKKCVLNGVAQPPNYDIPTVSVDKDQMKSSKSFSVIKAKDDIDTAADLYDFSSLQNPQQVLHRKQKGVWIKDDDMLSTFHNLCIYYNPNSYSHRRIDRVEPNNRGEAYDENQEILVVEGGEATEPIKLLVGLQFLAPKGTTGVSPPFLRLQKFDIGSFCAVSTVMELTEPIGCQVMTLGPQNSVLRIYSMSRGPLCCWISSSAPYKLMSLAEYATQYEGYTKKSLSIEHPILQAKTYFPLARIRMQQQDDQANHVLLKIVSCRQELLRHLLYRLVQIGDGPYTSQSEEGVVLRSCEKLFNPEGYVRLRIEANKQYYLMLEAYPLEFINDGAIQLMVLVQRENLAFNSSEEVEAMKYVEKYIPNKHGLLFKERIFLNTASCSSFVVRLVQGEEVAQAGGGGAKAVKKGGKQEPSVEVVEKPLSTQYPIRVNLVRSGEILYDCWGMNEAIIPCVCLKSTKNEESLEYSLESYFMGEAPETGNVYWQIRVIADESIAMVRDTKKEDMERQIRKSWEDQEPGRAERAKKARRKYLVQLKKEKGEPINEEELAILNAPRMTKKQQLEQEKKAEEKKNAKQPKKDDKKGAKKDEQPAQEKPIVQRLHPQSVQNQTTQLKEFLRILQNCSVRELDESEHVRIRSKEELEAIRQGALMSQEDRVSRLVRNIQIRETAKLLERDRRERFQVGATENLGRFAGKWSEYLEWRRGDFQKDKVRQEKQRVLCDLIRQQPVTASEADARRIMAEYKDCLNHQVSLLEVGEMVRKNIKIVALTDKITNHLAGWEVEELKAISEEIKNEQIEGINPEAFSQMQEMLEECTKNPNLAVQKQAEAKKQKKGAKK